MDPDKLITEARARIIWGEEISSVRDYLTSNGMSEMDANAKIQEFNLERNREIRGIGLRNTLIGAALFGGAAIGIYLFVTNGHNHSGFGYGHHGYGGALGGLAIAGVYGLWKLMKGIIYLIRPQSEHESIPDIDD
ncbi:MAG TPA: hypothetical protein VN048_14760 [Verrucomicrobiae bacterium]|jgi:hypothetical protein|nr:hypothetical protein [Verrucomicrobiae bacterium]